MTVGVLSQSTLILPSPSCKTLTPLRLLPYKTPRSLFLRSSPFTAMERLAQNGRYLMFSLVGAEIFTNLEVLEREKG